ncbi:MAG: YhfC family intramembrane metalloprotease [Anaerolineales bacterium]|nr:YhfC family intramembrane metalloprotease [Anaerolineales bacterium]
MNILLITHFLNGLLMIAMPIALAVVLTRRFRMGWGIWWIGVSAFILSQIGHIPFNWAMGLVFDNSTAMIYWDPLAKRVFNAIFLGLSAGVFEELTRYLVLRFWARSARSWRNAVLFGAGHGGIEALILGVLVLVNYFLFLSLRDADLSILGAQQDLAAQQIQVYWSYPWYDTLLGALERLFTIPCQIAMAVMVMQAFIRRKIGWLFLAIGYHALLDASAVLGVTYLGIYWTEALIGGFAVLSMVFVFLLRQPEPELAPEPVLSASPSVEVRPVEETEANLDQTKYT